ncbi:MAG: hypothetical protein D6B25_12665 [Desulfobulbaceae bacterium]|nr:MAG: hypothetical protein D6B25_12665 [Desulfobulbaceae bacterium]
MKNSKLLFLQVGLCCVLCAMLIPHVAHAESRFEQGFREIPWQTHKDQLPDLNLSKKALKNIYKNGPASVLFMEGRGNLKMSFDDVPLLTIFMHFNDQKFTGVDMLFKPDDRERIIEILSAETGEPLSEKDGAHQWQTDGVKITVTDRELLVTAITAQ